MDISNTGNNRYFADFLRKAALMMLLSVFAFETWAEEDTLKVLGGIDVVARAPASGLRRRGNVVSLSSSALQHGMRVLGAADAICAMRLTPGVSSGSDYASGLSVNGSPLSQSAYLIDGIPVFFPFHFGGIFSTFNTPHFKSFSLDMTGSRPDAPMRAGAVFEASSADAHPDSVTGVADVGLITSSLTLKVPIGAKTMVSASARTSYISLIAPLLIDNNDNKVRYSFTDANLSVVHRPDSSNILKFTGFFNTDKVRYTDLSYSMATRMHWINALGGASWLHSGSGASTYARISISHSSNRFGVSMPQLNPGMLSGITQLSATAGWKRNDASLLAGAGADMTLFTPQHPSASASAVPTLKSGTAYAFSAIRRQFTDRNFLEAYLRLSMSSSGGHTYVCADPRITIERITDSCTTGIDISVKSQYMQQVGFSDIGMSANFWLPAMKSLRPMRSAGIDIRHRRPELLRGVGLNISTFARYVRHESQYRGMLTDILAPAYDALANTHQVDGFNVGGNLMLDINIGPVSGWAGYSVAVCRRKYPEYPGQLLPSASEPLHSLKLLGEVAASARLKISTFFSLATGRRYTPVEAVYALAGNILIEYGKPYSATLPLYHRLDISATYDMNPLKIGQRYLSHFMTFTIINAYGHRNAELTTISYDAEAATLSRDFITSLYRFLPSVSYTLQF